MRPPESYVSRVLNVWPVPHSDFWTQIVPPGPQKPLGPFLVWGGRRVGRTLGRTVKRNTSMFFWLLFSVESTSDADRNPPPLLITWCSFVWEPRAGINFSLFDCHVYLYIRTTTWQDTSWGETPMWVGQVEDEKTGWFTDRAWPLVVIM